MTVLRACLLATVLLVLSAGTAAADHGYWPDGGVDPARVAGHRAQTDTNSAGQGPSLSLRGFGLVLGLLASLGAIASVIGRAAAGSPPRRSRG